MKLTTVKVTGILVTLIFNNVQCLLVTKPKDAVAKIGDIVIMNCSSSYVNDTCGKITWKHFKMKSESKDYIYTEGILDKAVTSYISLINNSTGHCDLEITATPLAAGRYQCFDVDFDQSCDGRAALIVLDEESALLAKAYNDGRYHGIGIGIGIGISIGIVISGIVIFLWNRYTRKGNQRGS